jgi:hypothetical protein
MGVGHPFDAGQGKQVRVKQGLGGGLAILTFDSGFEELLIDQRIGANGRLP